MRFAASPAAFTAAKASPLYGAAVDTSASLPQRMMPMISRLPLIALPLLALAAPLPAAAQERAMGAAAQVLSDPAAQDRMAHRSEERRGGKEGVSTGRIRGAPEH